MTEKQTAISFSSEPELILPFEIDREQAAHIFLRRFAADKMASADFSEAVHHNSFGQQYISACLFECDVTTAINADCTKRQDGAIAEYSAERTVQSHFSEIIMYAGSRADDTLLRLLEPYNLEKAEAFSAEALGEIQTDTAEAACEDLFAKAKPEIEKLAKEAAEKTLKDYTDKKTVSCTHSFSDITAKHILLPVWVLECSCSGRPCRIFLNGQTGRVAGVPPRSIKKAAALIGTAAVLGAAAAQIILMAVKALL